MTWSYTGDPSTDDKDAVRFLIGDTVESEKLVEDEEIAWAVTEWSDVYLAAASIADSVATQYAVEGSVSADGMSFSGTDVGKSFAARATQLRKMSGWRRQASEPYVGGISWAERVKSDQDTDLIQPHFRSHQHDHPESGSKSAHNYSDPLKSDQ